MGSGRACQHNRARTGFVTAHCSQPILCRSAGETPAAHEAIIVTDKEPQPPFPQPQHLRSSNTEQDPSAAFVLRSPSSLSPSNSSLGLLLPSPPPPVRCAHVDTTGGPTAKLVSSGGGLMGPFGTRSSLPELAAEGGSDAPPPLATARSAGASLGR